MERQKELSGSLPHTPAKPGPHNWGCAVDLYWVDEHDKARWDGDPELWRVLGHAARTQKLIWGGDWKPPTKPDFDHIQGSPAMVVLARAWKALQAWRSL